MAVTGVVLNVSPVTYGDALSADVAIGDTVLPLSSATAFEEDFTEARYLVIGDETTPREYVSPTQNDPEAQQYVTLATPLDVAFEAGLPVTLWDPAAEADDKRASDVKAWVRLDSAPEGNPIQVTVRHNAQPTAGDYALEGANVTLVELDAEWYIEEVLGRTAAVDAAYVSNPNIGRLEIASAQSIPNAVETPISPWTQDGNHPDLLLLGDSGKDTGLIWLAAGTYLLIITVRFAAGSGTRRVKLFRGEGVATEDVAETRVAPAGSAGVAAQVSGIVRGQDVLKVFVYQDSGGALNVTATGTQVQFFRLG